MKASRKQGFTLIELLVVIVIIGILAGALFGPITGALASARRSGMMNVGRHIVQAIITADATGRYRGYAWPADSNGEYDGDKPTGPDLYQAFSSTADYFTEALYMEETDTNRRNRLKVLQEIEPADLVADGYTEATGTTITDRNCAWTIASNAGRAAGTTPVLISRNINGSTFAGTAGNDTGADYDTLLTDNQPFGKDGCVLIYRDGSGRDFDAAGVLMRDMVSGLGNGKLTDIEQDGNAFKFLETGSGN